ncbi:Fur family transcriptional regulator [Desulfurobacterium indicum]|uniref:Transcriptional repressor n=1 Tax=Desulfurobacterium indicum TaxID=1914305 RepID=A0A1R1MM49_9BACT|nr:transcriptional repressor [Desulfurobacterium indicum]OMH40885.1 transcriptional repressor [Desulfurobacterium indicum]
MTTSHRDKKGKRQTRQKVVIYRTVITSKDHPTAEQVYERARKELSTISLATVYRVLKELVKEGKISEIVVNKQSRYDYKTEYHHHFVCTYCGKIFDIDIPICQMARDFVEGPGHIIENAQHTFFGKCKFCAEKEKKGK